MPNLLRTALAAALLAAGVVTTTPTVAGAAPVTITADYNANAGTFDHAKFLNANEGGFKTHKSLNWLPESYPQLEQAGMKLVVLTHLLNENFYNVVSRRTDGTLAYDFTKLDRVVDPLVEEGMTPVMGIGFTPQVLGGADKGQGYNPSIPNNYGEWKQVVDALVRYYAAKGPKYKGWYWEVWNEPDLRDHNNNPVFWAGSKTAYNDLYNVTADAVKAADPTAKVGGPGITPGGFVSWFDGADGFATYLRNRTVADVPFDFLSFHTYGGNGFPETDAAKVRLANAGRTGVPIFVTEWNITSNMAGGAGTPQDTNANASYAVRRMADAWNRPEIGKIFWFAPKEGWEPTKLFSGNLGMITVDGHKKASYNAFWLMNRLQTRLMKAPRNDVVGAFATRDPGSSGKVSVLAWSDQAADTDLTLSLTNLPYAGRNVRVTQHVVDFNHGNHYLDYAEKLRGWQVGPYESADPVDSRIVTGAAQLTSTVKLKGHGVVLFELEPTDAPATNVQQLGPTPIPVGSRNLAFGRPVLSSTAPPYPGWSNGGVVDGLTHSFPQVDGGPPSNGWTSIEHPTAAATEAVGVDLGGPVQLSRVKLFPRDDKDCEGYGFPIDFQIQGRNDGGSWQVLRTVNDYNGGRALTKPVGAQTFTVSGKYRYVQVVATELQLGCPDTDGYRYFQLAELQVESDDNLARTATVVGETTLPEAGWAAGFANDGVESSSGSAKGWSSAWQASATSAQDLTVTLAAPTMLSRVDLVPRDDAGNVGEGFPKTFKVWAASNSGCTDWVQVASRANHPDPGKFTRTVGFEARLAKCVKVEATVLDQLPGGSYAFQLAEVKVLH
jgi:beta-xylosidase